MWREKLAKEFPHYYQGIARKVEEGATINFEKLYRKAYESDYQYLNKRQKKLIELVKAGDLEGIKKHVPLKISDFQDDKYGKNLTLWAIYFHHDDILQYINTLKIFRHTPTNLAIITHRDLENYENLQFTITSAQDAAWANNLRALEMIAETSPDLLDHTNPNYKTPLILAAGQGNTEVVQFLLKAEVNKYAIRLGSDALLDAVRHNHIDTVKVLISSNLALDNISLEGLRPIHYAARDNYQDILQMLLEKNPQLVDQLDYGGKSPLIRAASQGHSESVNLLIKSGATIDLVSTNLNAQWTALQYAVYKNKTETTLALLEAGADPNRYFTHSNKSLLHVAAQYGNMEIVTALLEEEPKLIAAKDSYGKTALYYAAQKGHFEVEKLLLNNSPRLPSTEKYKHQSFFWAKAGKSRNLLKLKNLRAKYLNKDSKELTLSGKTIRFSAKDKRVAAEHLIEATLDNDMSKLSEKDKKVLGESSEFKSIYKNLKQ